MREHAEDPREQAEEPTLQADGAGELPAERAGEVDPPAEQPGEPIQEPPLSPWLSNGVIVPTKAPVRDSYGPLVIGPGIVVHSVEDVLGWVRSHSLWMLMFGLACCAIEMMHANASKFDLDRFGIIPRGSPRQSDLLIVSGTVTYKVAPMVKRVYEQMAEPRWVIAMGNCATAGSLYFHDGYSVVKGVDQVIPVDVYVSGCPPRPEALIDGIVELRRLIEGKPTDRGREGRS
ncbi:MAG TPA: NADH-quinone oxidoreductase subunit NuoB [Thermoleophilia bacterium]|nr:NADH-quinone oxidoreductase subunit NuoB [Thermoleophilia bacterium]